MPDECCVDAMRDFLIKPDKFVLKMADIDNVVPVCADKLHLHNDHLPGMSCLTNEDLMGKSASKGKGLIILHAVAPNRPLCEQDPVTNVPHDNLIWKGGASHPKGRFWKGVTTMNC